MVTVSNLVSPICHRKPPATDGRGFPRRCAVGGLRMTGGRAWAIPLALAIDGVFGEPPSWLHPVVWIGTVIAVLERRAPRAGVRGVIAGAALTGVTVGGSALAGCVAARLIRYLPWPLALLAESWLLKTMLSVRALLEAGAGSRAFAFRRRPSRRALRRPVPGQPRPQQPHSRATDERCRSSRWPRTPPTASSRH